MWVYVPYVICVYMCTYKYQKFKSPIFGMSLNLLWSGKCEVDVNASSTSMFFEINLLVMCFDCLERCCLVSNLVYRDYQLSNEEVQSSNSITLLWGFIVSYGYWKLTFWITRPIYYNATPTAEEELNEQFFKALSHVQEIHTNCKILLLTHHQVWVQAECKRLGDSDNPEVSELLTAVRCLKERLALFKYCAEEVIMFRIYDPLRYGLFIALASERDLVFILLDPDAMVDTGPSAWRFSQSAESDYTNSSESDVIFVLDRILEGVCWAFKVRVEQVLQSQPSLITAYKLSNTLEFYCHTMKLLGRETALCDALWLLKDATQQTFFDILKTRGDKILRYPPLVALDLSPPLAVTMVPASAKKPDFEPVISALLDPVVQMCEKAVEAHKSNRVMNSLRRSRTGSGSNDFSTDSSASVDATLSNSNSNSSSQNNETPSKIFLVNCLTAILQPLMGHDVAREYMRNLEFMIERHVNVLVEKEEIRTNVLVGVDQMSSASFSECLRAFFGLILGSDSASLPEFEQMQVPRLRSEACPQVGRLLADAYELVYNTIVDPKNGYPDPNHWQAIGLIS
ncbi:hypothetical protein MKW92_045374 [Papaver armeniacum]|nr:hypothetical protein MKW92_045374 [Papaver armeniacum]